MATTSPNSAAPSQSFGRFWVKFYRTRGAIRRGWWILALTIGLGLAYQGWQVYKAPQLYASESQLNIREGIVGIGDENKFNVDPGSFVGTQLELMKSPEVLRKAQARVALEHPELPAEMPSVAANVVPRSFIFTLSAKGLNSEYTRVFVDAAITEFISFRDEQRLKTITSVYKGTQEQSREIQLELDKYRKDFQDFVEKNNMAYWAEKQRQATDYYTNLANRQKAMKSELLLLQTQTPDQILINSAPAQGGGSKSAETADAAGDSVGASLYAAYLQKMQEMAVVQARMEERSRVWKPRHPRFQELQRQLEELGRSIQLIKQTNRDSAAQRVEALKKNLELLNGELEEYENKIAEAGAKDEQYKRLQANVKRAEDSLDKIRNKAENYSGIGAKIDVFSIIKPATEPEPVSKGVVKHILMGLLSGAIVGLAIIMLRDRVDDRLASSSEMLEHFNEPILGQIPAVHDSRIADALPLLQPDDERYSYVEAYRSLRSSLIFMPTQTEMRTLLVTSAIPNEGKSTISCNLAITMAAAGAKIILVDADLRRGDLSQLFEQDGRVGLSSVLKGDAKWQDAAQETRYPTLTLLPRGPVSSQSSELLLLPSLEKLLNELKEEFDLVLFNTAPILATDDTPTLAPHFDGSLMVMRAQFTSARLTHNALNALYQRQVNVLGLILNCVDTETPDYYYYRYPQYYATN